MANIGIIVDASDERIVELQRLKEMHLELRHHYILYGDELGAANSGLVIAQIQEVLPRMIGVRMGLCTQARMYLHDGRRKDSVAFVRRWILNNQSGKEQSETQALALSMDIGYPIDYSLAMDCPSLAPQKYLRTLLYWAQIHDYYRTAAELYEQLNRSDY